MMAITRSPMVSVEVVNMHNGTYHINTYLDRSPQGTIKLDHAVTIYEAMAVAATHLRFSNAFGEVT